MCACLRSVLLTNTSVIMMRSTAVEGDWVHKVEVHVHV
jgi:hypothetical protein